MGNRPEVELDELLAESVEDARRRERTAFDDLVAPHDGAVLFGAGGLGRHVAGLMRGAGRAVVAFADNAERLWGASVDGIPVLSPAEAATRFGSSCPFVVTIWSAFAPGSMPERIEQLRALGCRRVAPFHHFLWKHDGGLPYFNVDLPSRVLEQKDEIRRAMSLWEDDFSRAEYVAQVRARLWADFASISPPLTGSQYFPPDLTPRRDDHTYVDAGAFDGDSLEQFIGAVGGRFRTALAFEPDPDNYRKLCAKIDGPLSAYRERIVARRQAVSDKPGETAFLAGEGMSSRFGAGETRVETVTLDSLLDEGIAPTYMKFDVEGFEPRALQGAAGVISGLSPTLAVCVYHKQDHLWTLPLAVRRLNSHYRFFLRPYGFIWDEVCLAAPR